MAQIQNLKYICIAHLISKSNSQKIKILNRFLRFQCKEWNIFLTHDLIQIQPRGKHTLRPDILAFVEHIIEDHHAEVGHTDFIDIREAHGKSDIYVVLIFHYRVNFTTNIAGGLVNFH